MTQQIGKFSKDTESTVGQQYYDRVQVQLRRGRGCCRLQKRNKTKRNETIRNGTTQTKGEKGSREEETETIETIVK